MRAVLQKMNGAYEVERQFVNGSKMEVELMKKVLDEYYPLSEQLFKRVDTFI